MRIIRHLMLVCIVMLSLTTEGSGKDLVNSEHILLQNNSNIQLFGNLTIKVTDIIYESIEASPLESDAYPGGSGVTVHLSVNYLSESSEIVLTLLTEPYQSETAIKWNGFIIELIGVYHGVNPTSKLVVRKYD